MASRTLLNVLVCIIAACSCVCVTIVDAKRGKADKSCFRNEIEAGSVGSLLLASFFRDLQASDCEPENILKVYKKYAEEDFPFSVAGEVLVRCARQRVCAGRTWPGG